MQISAKIPTGLPVGHHRLVVCADVRSQVRERSENNNCRSVGTLTIAAPSVPPLPPPPAPLDVEAPDTTISSGPQGLTASRSASFALAATEAGSSFECRLDSASWAACESPASHSTLAQGPHAFEARAIDGAGNRDQSPARRTWAVDTIAPETTIVAGPTGDMPAGPVDLTFAADETGSTFACRIDDEDFAPCSSPLAVAAPTAGPHAVQVRAIDSAGNVDQTPAVREWTTLPPVTSAPDTTILSAPSGRTRPGSVDIMFESDEPFSAFQCKVDAAAYAPCLSPLQIEAPGLGAHTVDVRAIDSSGNPDPTPARVSWRTVAARVDLCGEITTDRTIGPDDAFVFVVTCNLRVTTTGTLRIEPDTIVKATSGTSLIVDGSLVANGTAGSPVTLTSWHDDSVGGDTSGDGTATTPAPGNWPGINVTNSGSLDLTGTVVRYAQYGAMVGGGDFAKFSIVDSRIEHSSESGVLLSASLASAAPVLTGNTITSSGGPAIQAYSLHIDVAKLVGNSGSGNHGGLQLSGTIDRSGTLSPTGLTPQIGPASSGHLRIAAGATLTLPAGAVWKSGGNGSLIVDGSLVANGTAGSPVTLTSWHDDSVGGDTSGDGTATTPAPGNWPGINVGDGGVAELSDVSLRYASTALDVADGGGAQVRGAILSSLVGIRAATFVDARHVDWGSASGPAPWGSGTPIEGRGVLFSPWVGYVPPPRPPVQPYQPAVSEDCTPEVLFIGARGSGDPPQGDPPMYSSSDPNHNMGARVYDIFWAFNQRMSQVLPETSVKPHGLEYRALGVANNPFDFGHPIYTESIYGGIDSLEDFLIDRAVDCPNQRFVLSGYSQGALVVHVALVRIAQTNPSLLSRILGVALLADPAKTANGNEIVWEDKYLPAGTGVSNAEGLWTQYTWFENGAVPNSIADRTISLCFNKDVVCAPPLFVKPWDVANPWGRDYLDTHTRYPAETANALGYWAAERTIAALGG